MICQSKKKRQEVYDELVAPICIGRQMRLNGV